MISIRIIPKGDLALVNGTTVQISGAAYATQRIGVCLDIFLGEWFLNVLVGMPYFRDVLVHSPNAEVVKSVFRKAIMNTPGIVSVPTVDVELNTSTRKGTVNFVAVYQDGTVITQARDLII